MPKRDAARARALVGVKFRPQGRDPVHGLDCVGLCLAAYRLPPASGRTDYRLRGPHLAELKRGIDRWFKRVSAKASRAGDLLLIKISDEQFHLAVSTDRGFVHADARLGLVVETPGTPPWTVIGHYRVRRGAA